MITRWSLSLPIFTLMLLPILWQASLAHDHTRKTFARQRAVAQLQAQQQSERAPRTAAGDKSCRLTLELTNGEGGKPVAGLVRVTNRGTGKPLALTGEIQRDALWYAISPGAEIEVPPAKLTVEAVIGLHTEKAVREIDLTGKGASSLKLSLAPFYDPAARGLSAGNTHLHLMKLTHRRGRSLSARGAAGRRARPGLRLVSEARAARTANTSPTTSPTATSAGCRARGSCSATARSTATTSARRTKATATSCS